MNALTPLLAGINRYEYVINTIYDMNLFISSYNPVHIETLEQFVQFQVSWLVAQQCCGSR